MRICTGAFQTTPILSLYVEAGEVCAKLALNCFKKKKSFGSALSTVSAECLEFRKRAGLIDITFC